MLSVSMASGGAGGSCAGPVVRLRDVEQPVCLFLSGVVGKGPQ